MSLATLYKLMWSMTYKDGHSISDVESMIPYERDIFIDLTIEDINKKIKEASNG